MLHKVNAERFNKYVTQAIKQGGHYKHNLSAYSLSDYKSLFHCYLDTSTKSGYAIKKDTAELCSVFSLTKGCGDKLVQHAIYSGAKSLDCFDGYLVSLYKRHGFKEVRREANWVDNQPDVVYMEV